MCVGCFELLIQDDVIQISLLPGFFMMLFIIIVVIFLFARYWGRRTTSARDSMDDRWLSSSQDT